MSAPTRHHPKKFAVAQQPEPGFGLIHWTITENGIPATERSWTTPAEARAVLNSVLEKAETVVSHGYFQDPQHSGLVWVRVDGERIDIPLPYGWTPRVRTETIRTAAIEHYLDAEVSA